MKKYKLTDETIEYNEIKLHRIKALRSFDNVEDGDVGGWVESESNLSQCDNAWVFGDAMVFGDAKVFGDAMVFGDAKVYDNAIVYGNARVYDNAMVYGNARVYDYAKVCGDTEVAGSARVYGKAEVVGDAKILKSKDYIVFKNWWSSGRYFTWTRPNNMWRVGCFYGDGESLVKKAYGDTLQSGREYERVVKYVESILAEDKQTSASDSL